MNKKKEHSGFKVPKGYFENFDEKLRSRLVAGEETTSQLPKQDGFRVPNGYFESFETRLRERMPPEKPAKVISLWQRYRWTAIAAVGMFLFGLYLSMPKANDSVTSFDQLAQSDIEAYFNDTDLGLNSMEIAELVPVGDLEMGDLISDSLEEEELIDYMDLYVDNVEELNYRENE